MGMNTMEQIGHKLTGQDKAESTLSRVDQMTAEKTGMSLLHILTLVSIVGSIALFMSGRKLEALFVGLWPPTIQALKSAAENK